MPKAKRNQYFLGEGEEGYLIMYGDITNPREAEVIALFYDEALAKEYLIYVLGLATPVDKIPVIEEDTESEEEESDNVFDLVEQFDRMDFKERRKAPTLKELLDESSSDDQWES